MNTELTPAFFAVLETIGGQSEIDSIATLRAHPDLTVHEFHLLLGRAIRQPELLEMRLTNALGAHGLDKNGNPPSCPTCGRAL